jgi:deazaflavin-dependent oxidoreductase (nitroreductase family)
MSKPESKAVTNDFPAGLSQPALRALDSAGYTRLEQLVQVTESDLHKLHGMGPKGINLLRSALNARGLAFAGQDAASDSPAPGEPVYDSPEGWIQKHIREYVDSNGQKGHLWRGIPTLLLTTRGRKSGKLRRTALIYGRDGDAYMVVASNGGSRNHPLWYLNLVADPEVELQVEAKKFSARARTATPAEKARLWPVMAKIFPRYDLYQSKAGRDIPLVILEPE